MFHLTVSEEWDELDIIFYITTLFWFGFGLVNALFIGQINKIDFMQCCIGSLPCKSHDAINNNNMLSNVESVFYCDALVYS